MIVALLMGREGSKGYPGKNTAKLLGRPVMAYPLMAAKAESLIDRVYVTTDSPYIMEIAREYGASVIDRPDYLCTDAALGEDVIVHGFRYLVDELHLDVELLVVLLCNSPTIDPPALHLGITALREDRTLDSAITVSRYNMWSPLRARKLGDDGLLHPFVPFETFGDPKTLTCDRDSQGDVWYADMGMSIMRPRCFSDMPSGLLPQRWMGRKIAPVKQWGGLDIDYPWQMPQAEYWLRAHGFTETKIPYATNLQHA